MVHLLTSRWQAVEKGKINNQTPVFDLTDDNDKITGKLVKEIQEHFTSPEKLQQINHPYNTQLTE